jgi:uncharacterized protein (DUF3084 family)
MTNMSTKTPRNKKAWTKKEEQHLRGAARRREAIASVARRLGRTPAATQQKAMRIGVSFR